MLRLVILNYQRPENVKKIVFSLWKLFPRITVINNNPNYSLPYWGGEIDVINKDKLNENYTIVNSILIATDERPEINIDWRIYTKDPNNPLIRDLIIEGLSLARTQKEEFASVLSSNDDNIDALFKVLEEFIIK